MKRDHWGYPLSTDSSEAIACLIDAFRSFSQWRTDMLGHLDRAIDADPGFALPMIIKGVLICSLRRPEALPKAQALYDRARAANPLQTEREKLYLQALKSLLTNQTNTAIGCFEAVNRLCPHDLLAIRQAQAELFWLGEAEWMRDLTERVASHWQPDDEGFAHYQALRAFGLEEMSDYDQAERCGRDAVMRDPGECWGAHAVAHVLIMQARLDEGIAWIDGLGNNWQGCNHIVHHLWWHLALFHTERGDYAAALDIYDNRLRDLSSPLMKAIPDYFVDLQNDVSILQRLELQGVDGGDRWQPVAELAHAWSGNGMSGFTSAHAALALAAAGREADAEDLIKRLDDQARQDQTGDLAGKINLAALPAAKAALAFRRNDHRRVVDLLYPARRQLWHMGGSHAQRDLFFQLLCTSANRLGEHDKVTTILGGLRALGFDHMDERTSYRAIVATATNAA